MPSLFDLYRQAMTSVQNNPLQWGLQGVIDQRADEMKDPNRWGPNAKAAERGVLENNYMTLAPWLNAGRQRNISANQLPILPQSAPIFPQQNASCPTCGQPYGSIPVRPPEVKK